MKKNRRDVKNKIITVKFSPNMVTRMKKVAGKSVTMSEFIRSCVEKHLKEMEAKNGTGANDTLR